MDFPAMKKVSAFQSVRIIPKMNRPFLSEDGVDVAVPMQASTQRPSVDNCQGDMYTVARNIRVMALRPYESGVLNPVGKLHSPKFEQRGYSSRKQLNKYTNTCYCWSQSKLRNILQAAIKSQSVTSRCSEVHARYVGLEVFIFSARFHLKPPLKKHEQVATHRPTCPAPTRL